MCNHGELSGHSETGAARRGSDCPVAPIDCGRLQMMHVRAHGAFLHKPIPRASGSSLFSRPLLFSSPTAMLIHTVLAVAYGGLLASASPSPWGAHRPAEDADARPAAYRQSSEGKYGGAWEWGARVPQVPMDNAHAEDAQRLGSQEPVRFPDGPGRMPKPPFEMPHPPQHPPPPPPPPPPGPPPKFPGPPPHPGHDEHHPPHHPPPQNDTSTLTVYQILESNPQ